MYIQGLNELDLKVFDKQFHNMASRTLKTMQI